MQTNREMTKLEVERLRARLTPLLERLGAETGFTITMGRVMYSRFNASFAVEASVRGEGGVAMTSAATAFLRYAFRFELEPGDLGRDFEHLDKWYRIVGMRPRSTKTPVICQQIAPPSQHRTLFSAHLVRHYLEKPGMRAQTSPHAGLRIEIGEPSREVQQLEDQAPGE